MSRPKSNISQKQRRNISFLYCGSAGGRREQGQQVGGRGGGEGGGSGSADVASLDVGHALECFGKVNKSKKVASLKDR